MIITDHPAFHAHRAVLHAGLEYLHEHPPSIDMKDPVLVVVENEAGDIALHLGPAAEAKREYADDPPFLDAIERGLTKAREFPIASPVVTVFVNRDGVMGVTCVGDPIKQNAPGGST